MWKVATLDRGSKCASSVAAICSAVIVLVAPASAADLLVPSAYPTIQAAIDAAKTDDTVIVAPGEYVETLTLDKAITVRSEGGAEVTTIRGNEDDSVVEITADATLSGFTLTRGGGTFVAVGLCGGGVLVSAGAASVFDCILTFNDVGEDFEDGRGGGVCVLLNAELTIVNCVLKLNFASSEGGGFYLEGAADIRNCTVRENDAQGPAIYRAQNNTGFVVVYNSILWDNTEDGTGELVPQIEGNPINFGVSYSNVEGGVPDVILVNDNIDADPLFLPDDTLDGFSPCIDAGSNILVASGTTADLAGNARVVDDVNVADRGGGTAPIVDMGAYERQTNSEFPVFVPAQFTSIQDAIDVVAVGAIDAVIEVSEGLYRENIDLRGRALRLTAPTFAVIEGQDEFGVNLGGSVVTCASFEGPDTILENFLFSFGHGTDDPQAGGRAGGGMFISFASPTLINCAFTDNLAEFGGAVYVRGGSPTFIGGSFDRNQAARTFQPPGDPRDPPPPEEPLEGTGSGGAMYIDASFVDVNGTSFGTFDGNTAGQEGGAVTTRNFGVLLVTNGAEFVDNDAPRGGAILNADNSTIVADLATFRSNLADDSGGAIESGALCTIDLSHCIFQDNTAVSGGAISIVTSGGFVENCLFDRNQAMQGGAVKASTVSPAPFGPPLMLVSSTFEGNVAGTGAGMFNSSASPQLTNCLFDGNIAATYGGGLCNTGNSLPVIANCTFTTNDAFSGGAIQNFSQMSMSTISNSIIWGNTATTDPSIGGFGTSLVDHSDVGGGAPGLNNIDADPLFVTDTDRRLRSGSPCLDAGSNGSLPPDATDLNGNGNTSEPVPLDLVGSPRVQNTIVDMGAFEGFVAGCPGDLDGDDDVGFGDLSLLLGDWGVCDFPPAACPGDISPPGGDGQVGFGDLAVMLGNWGGCS